MNLEDQVCSLELAKKLKELSVKQKSYFSWVNDKDYSWQVWNPTFASEYETDSTTEWLAAFTVSELGEMLPPYFCTVDAERKYKWSCEKWSRGIIDAEVPTQYANTEADARAKTLIYLIENKLITL